MGTRNGMCIRFSEEHIRTCGRVSMGVKAIRLEEGRLRHRHGPH